MKLVILLKWLKDLYRHKNMLMHNFAVLKKEEEYKNIFIKKFGYFPVGLKYENIDMLECDKDVTIGDYNKIIYSQTQYPTSAKH
ncbi:MAG: hypothetical protein NTZ59_15065, partial [Bacteroidetes bacterium]|nr:hypothetical protein [Bacteroidota bacterium]